jgi:L-arabinose transport system substrate-binding protein
MSAIHRLCGGALALAAIVAVGSSALAQDKLIVNINKNGTQQYFIDQANGFTAAAEELGYDATVINIELDSNLAVSAIADAIAAGAKGIAITVPDQAIGPAVTAAVGELPLVATNDSISDAAGAAVPYVGYDGKDMGTKVGIAAAELITAAGWTAAPTYGVLSVEVQTLSVCNDRTNASRAEVEKVGVDAARIFAVPYDGTTNSALEAAGPVITAHPDVEKWIIFGCNDEGVLGSINALTNAGFSPDDIIGVGLGAYEACKPWAAGQASGFKAALYISGVFVGDAAARALINTIETGEPLPANTVAEARIIGPDNYKDTMPCT